MGIAFGLGVGFIIGSLVSRWRRKPEDDNKCLPWDTGVSGAGIVLIYVAYLSQLYN